MRRLLKGDAVNLDLNLYGEDLEDYFIWAINDIESDNGIELIRFQLANRNWDYEDYLGCFELPEGCVKPFYLEDFVNWIWNMLPENASLFRLTVPTHTQEVTRSQIRDFFLDEFENDDSRNRAIAGGELNHRLFIDDEEIERWLSDCFPWLNRIFRIDLSDEDLKRSGFTIATYYNRFRWKRWLVSVLDKVTFTLVPDRETKPLYLETLVDAIWDTVPPENRADP